jgi:hypothetical protein
MNVWHNHFLSGGLSEREKVQLLQRLDIGFQVLFIIKAPLLPGEIPPLKVALFQA